MSLDVVLGSGLLNLAIAKYYGVNLPFTAVAGLMIAVWLIYTYDHLSDAKKVDKAAATYRHRFHQQHYKSLTIALLLMMAFGVGVLFFLPLMVLKWGVMCAAIVAFYFVLLKLRAFWFKELLIAICYTIGVFLAPLSLSGAPLTTFQLLLTLQILLLALANLIIFSCFDYESDQQDGHYSLAIHIGLARSRVAAISLVGVGLAMCVLLFFSAKLMITQEVQLLIFIMNLLLLLILLKERKFRQHDLYRIIGDGVFFIPALILLYGW